MELKFACADFTFPLLSHRKSLELIKLLDIDSVDLGFFQDRSHLQPSEVFKNIPAAGAEIKHRLDTAGLQPADLFLQLAVDFHSKAVNNPDPKTRDEARTAFLKTLEVADIIGSRHVTVLPGAEFESVKPGDSARRAVDELSWRVEKASDAGITLGVEAHLGSFCESPSAAADLAEKVEGLTLTLDYTHFTKLGIPDEEIELLMRYAGHFHARCACRGRAQTTMKNNTIDYKRVMKKMIESNYRGFVGFEYVWIEWEHMNETDNVSETLQLKKLLQTEFEKLRGASS
jgi:sugar phosphate isomerase/epimerase